MPNPLKDIITPALDLLGTELRILPATGGAVEDLQRPDADELDDTLVNEEVRNIDTFAEKPTPEPNKLYKPTPSLSRTQKHVFRYFIDGSLRTYYLGTGMERNRTFPIEIAQIGSACIKRLDDGSLTSHSYLNRLMMLIPGPSGKGVSDSIWTKLSRLDKPDKSFVVIDTGEKNIHSKKTVDLRTRAGGIARHRMHELEIEIISKTDKLRDNKNWVILDGAVKLDKFVEKDHLIGVAKSFSKQPQFHFKKGKIKNIDVTGLIAGLPYAHRTVAFSSYGGKVAFWYVRLWEQIHLDYPLMGVLKVELPCPKKEPVSAELIDLLSRALVGERSVTPYGKDRRWHCHLYPIFNAEQAIKNKFYSKEVILGAIRWPIKNDSIST